MTNWNGGSPKAQTQYIDDVVITTNTPVQRDAAGNPMIGPMDGTNPPPQPVEATPPTNLRIQ